jgi:hypothetical protein
MNRILLALTTTAALAAAAVTPAAAQVWNGDRAPAYVQPYNNGQAYGQGYDNGYGAQDYGQGYDNRRDGVSQRSLEGLAWRIDAAARDGRISRSQARQLRDDLRQLQRTARRVETGQASGRERQQIRWSAHRIETALNGYGRDGRDDRYPRDDRR